MDKSMQQSPIDTILPELKAALARHGHAVLVASPGAGKTTRVPLALLEEPWLSGGKIIMLEPRRIAARSAAQYMAAQLGEQVGETVGYRVRMDTRIGPRTRIEVVTEGVLTRMLQRDPGLEGVKMVIFDEFHERSLHADLGLALTLEAKTWLRDDLRLLVMSATMEAEPVSRLLGDAPIIVGEGRQHPVTTYYRPAPGADRPLDEAVAAVVEEALREQGGDLLVFLPGMAEIRSVERRLHALLEKGKQPAAVRIHPLHGSLPASSQDRALAPAPPGERKIVLSTSVAETSLTVEGVTVVIDSGLTRVSRFSPRTGMTHLETVPISKASADQRRGRAGRLSPGVCYRLWSEEAHDRLPPAATPEICEADLAPLVLELAAWGTPDPAALRWLDPPPHAAVQQARELLQALGALDADGGIAPHGREMAAFGMHPRMSHMLLRARDFGREDLACEIAVLLENRELWRKSAGLARPDVDFRNVLEALRSPNSAIMDSETRRRLNGEINRLRKECGLAAAQRSEDAATGRNGTAAARTGLPRGAETVDAAAGLLLALAYPDRIGRRREAGRYLLSGGRGAMIAEEVPLARETWIVAVDVEDSGADSRIRLAMPVQLEALLLGFADRIVEERVVAWDRAAGAVRARLRRKLGALLLEESALASPDPEAVTRALLDGIREAGIGVLPWDKAARQFRERIAFVRQLDEKWPDVSDDALMDQLGEWLSPYVDGMKSLADLKRLPLGEALEALLPWPARKDLDALAPAYWTAPSGSRLPIDYSDPHAPAINVRLQELFGLADTPRIAGGRVPLTLRLLSPAHRPVQVTRDLAGFWRNAYFEVRKDLKGRYPKHYWPDNPLEAEAVRGTKPRK
jgi:ATP-dependent helicase HrpB